VNGGGTTDGSVFEGIARAFKPEGAFAEELRRAGFDVHAPRTRYPASVLLGVLDVVHRHAYPELERLEAHRRIGERYVDCFFETLLGKVFYSLLRVLGLRRFLIRLPKIAPMVLSGLEVQVEEEGPGALLLKFHSEHEVYSPEFIAGGMAGTGRLTSDQIQVEIVHRSARDCELRVTGLR